MAEHHHNHCTCDHSEHSHHAHEDSCCKKDSHNHQACGAQHEKTDGHSGCACGCDGEITLEDGVSCGCGCGCGDHDHEHDHDHDHGSGKSTWIFLGIAVFLAAISFIPMPVLASRLALGAAALIAGFPLFVAGVKSILRLRLDETALLLIAVVAAMALGEFWEGALVTILFRLGNQLEAMAVARSKKSIAALTKIRPETANLLVDGAYIDTDAATIPVGSLILVRPGERVPLDAVIESGDSMMDTAVLTGESLPRPVASGDQILSGMINGDGALHCRTINSFSDSAASRIIQLVQESAAKKGNTEKLISKFSRIYTPCIIVAAIFLTFLPPLLGFGSVSMWLSRALVFLVASCPCALVISIPLSFFAGIGAGSKRGVLIKGSKSMEALAKVQNAVFDKTGTLTTGKLSVTEIVPLDDSLSADELLRLSALGESFSSHPMARAVVSRYGAAVDASGVTSSQELPGMGVLFQMGEDQYLCGGERLLKKYEISAASLPYANIYLAKNGVVLGYLLVADTLRTDAKAALQALKSHGVRQTIILTGDNGRTGEEIRQASGADQVWAELLPADKVSHLEQIRKTGCTLFVGDGMNDAPVLAMADVGVAMGLGTDAAIEAADVVLVSDRLSDLPQAVNLARRTLSIAKFNIVFALGIKAIVLILGACGLAAMWMAVFADVGVSILAVLNATRILRVKK